MAPVERGDIGQWDWSVAIWSDDCSSTFSSAALRVRSGDVSVRPETMQFLLGEGVDIGYGSCYGKSLRIEDTVSTWFILTFLLITRTHPLVLIYNLHHVPLTLSFLTSLDL